MIGCGVLRAKLFVCLLPLTACQGSEGTTTSGSTTGEDLTGEGEEAGTSPNQTATASTSDPTGGGPTSDSPTSDSSTTDAVPAVCGDGAPTGDEECDDGAENGPGAACKADCTKNVCGDGDLGPGETCDEGPDNGGEDSPCASTCEPNMCGDGEIGPGEVCDNGVMNKETGQCLPDCTPNLCGDGFVGPGEKCDDANDVDTDACTNECRLPACGDGILSPPESCDDDNTENDDGCDDTCQLELCGDGFLDPGEDCDDFKDHDPDDGCTDLCKFPACGDGFHQPSAGEQCDDGNADNTDACVANCKFAKCGDGYVINTMDDAEWCDDANQSWDDFCNPSCTTPKRVFVTSTTYDGNLGDDDGARAKCQARADAAGLGGTWEAWLSASHTPNFKFNFMGHVARLDKISISITSDGIYNGSILAPINVTEMGDVLANAQVWTHTNISGNRDNANDDTMGCLNFTSNHPNRKAGYGTTSAKDKLRTQAGAASCAEKKHLYCFDLEHYGQ